jgi:hypothetical protein
MRRLIREPLVHFLLLGAVIFAAYSWAPKRASADPGQIVITQGQLASMREGFTRTWQRPPTREEWEGLIRDRVREEVYYREALALGMDKDDLIIRRRLRQKMEFITEDLAALIEPTDDELRAYLKEYPDKFRREDRMPEFEEVRQVVRREWEYAKRREINEELYQNLLKRYTVTIEQPAAKVK